MPDFEYAGFLPYPGRGGGGGGDSALTCFSYDFSQLDKDNDAKIGDFSSNFIAEMMRCI